MKLRPIVSTVSLGVLLSLSPLVMAQSSPPAETKNGAGGASPEIKGLVPDRRESRDMDSRSVDSRGNVNERTVFFNRTNVPTEAQNDGGGGPTSLQMQQREDNSQRTRYSSRHEQRRHY